MSERSLTQNSQAVKSILNGASPLVAGLDRVYELLAVPKEGPMTEQSTIREYCETCKETKEACLFCPLNIIYEDEDWWALLPPDNQRDEFFFSTGDRTWLYCQHDCPKVEGELLRVGVACLDCKLWPIRPVWSPESDWLEGLRKEAPNA